jgi:hypothetical protein
MLAHARDAAPPENKFAAAHAAHSAFVQSALAGKLDIPIASALAINNVAVFPLCMLRNRILVFMGNLLYPLVLHEAAGGCPLVVRGRVAVQAI